MERGFSSRRAAAGFAGGDEARKSQYGFCDQPGWWPALHDLPGLNEPAKIDQLYAKIDCELSSKDLLHYGQLARTPWQVGASLVGAPQITN